MKIKRIFYSVALAILISGCATQKTKEIIILSTNDMHAKIDNYAKVAAYVDKIRNENKNVLLLSAGDMFSGNPIVDQYEEKGYPMIDIMNKVGYQYGTLGNHEFDYGQETLQKRIEQAKFKIMCGNIKCTKNAKMKQPDPFVKFKMDGIRICIFSTIQTDNSIEGKPVPATHPARLVGLEFTPPVEASLKFKKLRKNCDLLIALTHNGIKTDVEVAKELPEIDLIVGGHSHTRIDTGMIVNGVLITQAECHLKYIGKTTLTFEGHKLIKKKNELVDVSKLKAENEEVKNTIKKYYAESPLETVIGKTECDFTNKDELGNLMTDAITKMHKVDFAFQNSGGVRIKRMEKGDISLGKIYELDPFGNEVIVFDLTPAQIKSLIINSFSRENNKTNLYPSGLTYTVCTSNGRKTDVIIKTMDGKPLNENRKYKVGMNSYIASSYKFDHDTEGVSTNVTSAETLIDYIKKMKTIKPAKSRISVK